MLLLLLLLLLYQMLLLLLVKLPIRLRSPLLQERLEARLGLLLPPQSLLPLLLRHRHHCVHCGIMPWPRKKGVWCLWERHGDNGGRAVSIGPGRQPGANTCGPDTHARTPTSPVCRVRAAAAVCRW